MMFHSHFFFLWNNQIFLFNIIIFVFSLFIDDVWKVRNFLRKCVRVSLIQTLITSTTDSSNFNAITQWIWVPVHIWRSPIVAFVVLVIHEITRMADWFGSVWNIGVHWQCWKVLRCAITKWWQTLLCNICQVAHRIWSFWMLLERKLRKTGSKNSKFRNLIVGSFPILVFLRRNQRKICKMFVDASEREREIKLFFFFFEISKYSNQFLNVIYLKENNNLIKKFWNIIW